MGTEINSSNIRNGANSFLFNTSTFFSIGFTMLGTLSVLKIKERALKSFSFFQLVWTAYCDQVPNFNNNDIQVSTSSGNLLRCLFLVEIVN